jgi:hypothetical protein
MLHPFSIFTAFHHVTTRREPSSSADASLEEMRIDDMLLRLVPGAGASEAGYAKAHDAATRLGPDKYS